MFEQPNAGKFYKYHQLGWIMITGLTFHWHLNLGMSHVASVYPHHTMQVWIKIHYGCFPLMMISLFMGSGITPNISQWLQPCYVETPQLGVPCLWAFSWRWMLDLGRVSFKDCKRRVVKMGCCFLVMLYVFWRVLSGPSTHPNHRQLKSHHHALSQAIVGETSENRLRPNKIQVIRPNKEGIH